MNVLITGASRGIGRELVNRYAKNNTVYAVARNVKELKGLENVVPIELDLSDIDRVREVFCKLDVSFGMVIANAGISLPPVPIYALRRV